MKNYTKTIGFAIIAMAITLAFTALSLTGCDPDGNGGGTHSCTPGAAATCTTAQTCTDCGKVVTAALNHDWIDNWQANAIAATETEDGKDERTCDRAVCNEKQTRAAVTPEYATGTAGLAFEAIGSPATAYRVSRGTVATGGVHIPAMYRPTGTDAYLPVTEVANEAFRSTMVNPVTITIVTFADNSQLTSIGANGFRDIRTLTSIIIPESVTTIGNTAFFNSTIISINIPTGVTNIGNSVFGDITTLTSITIGENVTISATGHPDSSHVGKFRLYYDALEGGNKQAGTYTWDGTAWTGPAAE